MDTPHNRRSSAPGQKQPPHALQNTVITILHILSPICFSPQHSASCGTARIRSHAQHTPTQVQWHTRGRICFRNYLALLRILRQKKTKNKGRQRPCRRDTFPLNFSLSLGLCLLDTARPHKGPRTRRRGTPAACSRREKKERPS